MRRVDVSPDEWIQHRKLRKKIASAKWYANKKKKEIEEDHAARAELAERLLPKPEDRIWSDPVKRAHWHASMDYHCRRFPLRPAWIPVTEWVATTQVVHDWLWNRLPTTGERGCSGVHIPWGDPVFGAKWRLLAMGEWVDSYRTGTPWLGWTCSVIGAAFVAWHLRQEHLPFPWSAVARAMTHVVTISTMGVHNQVSPDPHIHPPNQNPTKNAQRRDMVEYGDETKEDNLPPNLATLQNWSDWIRWMNRVLFDPWNQAVSQELQEEEEEATGEEEETEADDLNDDWMDAYIRPYLTCELQPSSLDPPPPPSPSVSASLPGSWNHTYDDDDDDATTGDEHPHGYYADGQPYPGPSHSPCDEPPCWISETSGPPSISGNVGPEAPGRWNPTNA